ncbi:MAG: hypothetical protein WCO25_06420 [Candidatus Uhrbacteria bacterium]
MTTTTRVSLSEVLRQCKDAKGEIAELTRRATGCVARIEGVAVDFDFDEVNAERKAKIGRLVYLNTILARTNAATTVVWKGQSMIVAEVIRRKAELNGEITFVAGLALRNGPTKVATGEYNERHQPVTETVVWKSALTEPARVKLLASLRADASALDSLLQTSNHGTLVDLEDPAT